VSSAFAAGAGTLLLSCLFLLGVPEWVHRLAAMDLMSVLAVLGTMTALSGFSLYLGFLRDSDSKYLIGFFAVFVCFGLSLLGRLIGVPSLYITFAVAGLFLMMAHSVIAVSRAAKKSKSLQAASLARHLARECKEFPGDGVSCFDRVFEAGWQKSDEILNDLGKQGYLDFVDSYLRDVEMTIIKCASESGIAEMAYFSSFLLHGIETAGKEWYRLLPDFSAEGTAMAEHRTNIILLKYEFDNYVDSDVVYPPGWQNKSISFSRWNNEYLSGLWERFSRAREQSHPGSYHGSLERFDALIQGVPFATLYYTFHKVGDI
jgi:hypothetical protein